MHLLLQFLVRCSDHKGCQTLHQVLALLHGLLPKITQKKQTPKLTPLEVEEQKYSDDGAPLLISQAEASRPTQELVLSVSGPEVKTTELRVQSVSFQ